MTVMQFANRQFGTVLFAFGIWVGANMLDDWAVRSFGQEPGMNLQFVILYVAVHALLWRADKPRPAPTSGD